MKQTKRIFSILVCFCLLAASAADLLPRAYAATAMAASDSCIEFIKKAEGFSPQPYYDYAQYTVGYGTKCPTEKFFEYKSSGISKKEAEALLREEIVEIEDALNTKLLSKYGLSFSQHQFDALVSFSFNIGTGWVTSDSTLKNTILANGDDNDLVYAFGLYCTAGGKYLPGLVTRRLCEANMFLNGIYSQTVSDDFGYVYYDANGGTIPYRVQAFICENNAAPAADAVRNGNVFLGWYTDLSGGTQVSTLHGGLTGRTLFARWQSDETMEDQDPTSTAIKVTGDVVNIRSGPGTNYGIVSRAYRNDALVVSHVTHLTNMKWGKVENGWICLDYTNYDAVTSGTGDMDSSDQPEEDVTIPDDDSAWEDSDAAVDISPDQQETVTGYVRVNDFLNIRSGPGTAYSTVGYLFNNSKVSILEQKTTGTTLWGRMEKGWICMDYIVTEKPSADEPFVPDTTPAPEKEPEQTPVDSAGKVESTAVTGIITADALRIRSGAGTTHSIVGFYYQDDVVSIIEKVLVGSDYWGKTGKGWISMTYVQTDSATEEPGQPAENDKQMVIADCLRIRKDAGTIHKIVGFLYYGDTVSVSETKTIDGTLWGKVSKGWICMDYVN